MLKRVQNFINFETLAGGLLFFSALLAVGLANSPLQSLYQQITHFPLGREVLSFNLRLTFEGWVNDGLMSLFFLLVTLEIKREIIVGELNSLRKSILPIVAALGGMLVPVVIYLIFNIHDPTQVRGWAIPSATDTAFSLGVLALLGKRVPFSLKIFLTAVAIFDDIGAIIVIAIYYTDSFSVEALAFAACFVFMFAYLNKYKVKKSLPYWVAGLGLWLSLLHSGFHAVLAGVIFGFFIPLEASQKNAPSLLSRLEAKLHPFVAYLILPLFAFLNAGVSFHNMSLDDLFKPVPFGIALGLVMGKPLGIFFFSYIMVRFQWAYLPNGARHRDMWGISLLAGIGFTMSLFVGGLAFANQPAVYETWVRIGVITGSSISALLGYLFFRFLGHRLQT